MVKMCELCGEHPAEYQCDCCGKVVCQHCWNSNGICEECMDEIDRQWDKYHGPFA